MMIKAVLFDFGQTLVDSADGFRGAEKEAQARIFGDLRSDDRGSLGRDSFLSEYRRLRKEFQRRSNFSRKSLWCAVYQHFNRQPDEDVLEHWEKDYWRQVREMTAVFPETTDVLETLKGRYRLGLITNTQGQPGSHKHRLVDFPELERFFEEIIVAGEVGVRAKPDSGPFELCLQRLGVEPAEAVYVGDDWDKDVRGAQAAGLRAIWLKHHTVQRNWPQVDADVPVIDSLSPLADLEKLLA